jgi:hypothetical protein
LAESRSPPTEPRKRPKAARRARFGFGAVAPDPEKLAKRAPWWLLGRAPNRIDILTSNAPVMAERDVSGAHVARDPVRQIGPTEIQVEEDRTRAPVRS